MESFTYPEMSTLASEMKTYVYKTIEDVPICVDTYFPCEKSPTGRSVPLVVFIHGGAWLGGDRTEYCRPLFHEFLALGFVVNSIDYRLLPEHSFLDDQLEDIKDIEIWLRKTLPLELKYRNLEVDLDKIVVVGNSAGALLALLTPSLWTKPPTAILSIYGPTNMHHLPNLSKETFAQLKLPACTSEMLESATSYGRVVTGTPPPRTQEELHHPRRYMGLAIFRNSLVAEFLLRGLVNLAAEGEPRRLSLPERGSVNREEIDKISPLHLCTIYKYPSTCIIMGTKDELFDSSHVFDFAQALKDTGSRCKTVMVPDKGHAFDMSESIGGDVHTQIIQPSVAWISACLSTGDPGAGHKS